MDELRLEYLKMSQKAYPYLKGFIKPGNDELWCNPLGVYCQPWRSGPLHLDPEITFDHVIDEFEPPFRVLRQEEIQEIYLTEADGMHISTMEKSFHNWYWTIYGVREGFLKQHDWTILWLCFLMEVCFSRWWDGSEWIEIMEALP